MQYTTVDEFKSDVELMVSNAKKYNVKESYAYQDAIKIQASHKCIKLGSWRHLEIANADLSFLGNRNFSRGNKLLPRAQRAIVKLFKRLQNPLASLLLSSFLLWHLEINKRQQHLLLRQTQRSNPSDSRPLSNQPNHYTVSD
jgi:hypothetical protein